MMLSQEVEEGQNYPHNKTGEGELQRCVKILANKPTKRWKEGT